jgi:hypothetical protein
MIKTLSRNIYMYKMSMMNILEIFFFVLCVPRIIANSDFKDTCVYDMVGTHPKHSSNVSLDAEVQYLMNTHQNRCLMNVTEIYENVTKLVTVKRTQLFVSLRFICLEKNNDIHLTSLGTTGKFDERNISVQIVLIMCSLYMDELVHFQQYGHIWSVLHTNANIHRGTSCSSLQDLKMLQSILVCVGNETDIRQPFFWEMCDPFEQLFNLQLQGCDGNPYDIKHSFIQSKFPKLQTLWLKYINLTLSELTFPWTDIFINTFEQEIIKYLLYCEESDKYENTSITRTIDIYDCTVNFESDITFDGYISKIVINNNKIPKLGDTVFRKIRGLIVLDLSSNAIQEVDTHAFIMQNKLEQLNLARNNLTTLQEDVFDNLSNLLYLDLSSNRLSRVEQRHLKHLTKLKQLNLEQNSIKTLPLDFLGSQIYSIHYVFLSENPLENLPLNAFYAPKILFVDMRHCCINSRGLQSLLDNLNEYKLQTAYSRSLF